MLGLKHFHLLLCYYLTTLILDQSWGQKITKCCPLDQVLSDGGCVKMEEGTTLPKLRVGGSLVSFQWLQGQNKLRAGFTPSCVSLGEVFPDFTETATSEENVPHFSEDGVFIHELRFYLPGQYCVDGELDTEEYQHQYEGDGDEGRGLYEKVVVCEEKGDMVRSCKVEDPNCYHRCCSPWQSLHNDKCLINKMREKTSLRVDQITSMPDCEATLLGEGQFKLVDGAVKVQGGKEVQKGGYCLDEGRARVCKETVDVSEAPSPANEELVQETPNGGVSIVWSAGLELGIVLVILVNK